MLEDAVFTIKQRHCRWTRETYTPKFPAALMKTTKKWFLEPRKIEETTSLVDWTDDLWNRFPIQRQEMYPQRHRDHQKLEFDSNCKGKRSWSKLGEPIKKYPQTRLDHMEMKLQSNLCDRKFCYRLDSVSSLLGVTSFKIGLSIKIASCL